MDSASVRELAKQLESMRHRPNGGLMKEGPRPPPRKSSLSNSSVLTTTANFQEAQYSVKTQYSKRRPAPKAPGKVKDVSRSLPCKTERERPQTARSASFKEGAGRERPQRVTRSPTFNEGRSIDIASLPPLSPPSPILLSSSAPTEPDYVNVFNIASQPQEKPTLGLSLSEFMEMYSRKLPLKARILEGYKGRNLHLEVGDVCTAHFVTEKRVARVSDVGGSVFSIPLGSSLQFGMAFSPKSKRGEDVQRVEFEKVSDLIALRTLPKVVRATKAFKGSAMQFSVEEGEILIIADTKFSSAYDEMGLTAFSLLTKSEKILPSSCAGCFSIYPPLLRMHLPEFASYFSDSLPHKVSVFLDKRVPSEVANTFSTLLSSYVTVQEITTERSLVISSENESRLRKGLVDIPLNKTFSNIRLLAIPVLSKLTQTKLEESTRKLLGCLDPVLQGETQAGRNQQIQSVLYSTLRKESEGEGVTIISSLGEIVFKQSMPHAYEYVNLDSFASPNHNDAITSQTEARHTSSDDNDACYKTPLHAAVPTESHTPVECISNQECHKQFAIISREKMPDSSQVGQASVFTPCNEVSNRVNGSPTMPFGFEERLSALEMQVREFGQAFEELQEVKFTVNRLSQQVQSMENSMQQLFTSDSDGANVSARHCETKNVNYLRTLNIVEIQTLLKALNLQQYKETFLRENIDGELLSELDDEVLKQELGVSSKIHRIKLLKVIHGSHSARSILKA